MQSIHKIEERREMCSSPLCKWIAAYTVETEDEDSGLVQVLHLCRKHLKAWKRDQYDERHPEEETESAHCTAACQYAHKVKCVCGCKGANHGSKSHVKMDAFFSSSSEE